MKKLYKVSGKNGEELYYDAKTPKEAQRKAESEGFEVAMVTLAKPCSGEE